MQIANPINEGDFKECCRIYLEYNDPSFVRADPEYCLQNMVDHYRQGRYIKVIWDDGKIVGFIAATVIQSKHCAEKTLLQEYYCTNLKGFAAAKAVKLAHRDLVEHAKRIRVPSVTSCGSHMDPTHVFTRILEREGWKRQGHVAILRVGNENRPASPEGPSRSGRLRLSDLRR